jgi:hypothetical protein
MEAEMTLVLTLSITRTLAEEEKGKIVSIAVRPGKVDTNVRSSLFFVSDPRPLLELTRV